MSKKGQRTTSEALLFDDFINLLSHLHKDKKYQWELYCCISFCTACRISDVLSMTWNDILEKDELTKIERKTKKIRDITFNDSVRQRISELYVLMGEPDKKLPVVRNRHTGKPLTKEYINRTLKTFQSYYHLPIKNFSSHTFRKTFGRFVWDSMGRTMDALTRLCLIYAHDSPQTTMIYLGIRQEEIQSLYETIQLEY